MCVCFCFVVGFLGEETESVKGKALCPRLLAKPGASHRYISFEAQVLCMPSPDQSRSLLRMPCHCCAQWEGCTRCHLSGNEATASPTLFADGGHRMPKSWNTQIPWWSRKPSCASDTLENTSDSCDSQTANSSERIEDDTWSQLLSFFPKPLTLPVWHDPL